MTEPPLVPVAVVQAAPIPFDLAASVERLDALCREACAGGARLVVFPEAFLGGYPKGEDFGVRVGTRSDTGRALFQRYAEAALELPGPEVEHLAGLAAELDATLVVGVIERVRSGTLYCATLTVGPHGVLHVHRKTVPTALERVLWGCGDGSSVRAVDTPVGRVGCAICWENYMPLLRMQLYDDGVELYCAPTVDDRDTWPIAMRHIAHEGRCFVLSACQFTEAIRGGSCIVDPFGQVLAGPVYGERALLRAELDLGRISQGKFDLDVAGHYRFPPRATPQD